MDQPQILERMRDDWNQRAGEDANYYVAFGRRQQEEEEFNHTAADVVRDLEHDLRRFRGREAALEIGCGPGRLMRPLGRHFAEIHGVDVSDEMIRLARERLRDLPNAHLHHGSGADLGMFADGQFDFVYSYAVFQHIPSRDIVFDYLREARRVLKPGGIMRCQINGLPPHARQYDTWSGVRITADEVREFSRQIDFPLLALEKIWTQYMWVSWRKPRQAASAGVEGTRPRCAASLVKIGNALTGEAVAPSAGIMAAISIWGRNLPEDADLETLTVRVEGQVCRLSYIGPPEPDGVSYVNAILPEGLRTGLVPVEVWWRGERLFAPGWVRIMPPGPLVPRVIAVNDGINLLLGDRILTRTVKVTMLEVAHADQVRAAVDGQEVGPIDRFCTDVLSQRWEFNFSLPENIAAGPHEVQIALGRRSFAPVPIEVG
jgi:SAM-dependent methyltransferase